MADWTQEVQATFQSDSNLTARILAAGNRDVELRALFADIARHSSLARPVNNTKKRKLNHCPAIANPSTTFECNNVSFQVPVRKKLKLQIVAEQSDARYREVQVLNGQTNEVEYTISNAQMDHIFCLPVPEKQQRQSSFVILPRAGATRPDGTPCEQMVFTMNETKPDDATSSSRPKSEDDTYITFTQAELNDLLHPHGKAVIRPDENEFASCIPQPHRKGEKAHHVKTHRGTKEGYLFFLHNGILFTFKKPLAFFPFSSVESISYTSILQRTFNLVIKATEEHGGEEEAKDVEFSMIDQADFGGIDGYVKRHGLNDASMAAERRATVNKKKQEGEMDDDEEQLLQDREDEEEEDYVEESGGETDDDDDDDDGPGEDSEGVYDEDGVEE